MEELSIPFQGQYMIKKPYFPYQTPEEWRKSLVTHVCEKPKLPFGYGYTYSLKQAPSHPCDQCSGQGWIPSYIDIPGRTARLETTTCSKCAGTGNLSPEEFEKAFEAARDNFRLRLAEYFDLLKEQTLILSKLSRSEIEFLRKYGVEHE